MLELNELTSKNVARCEVGFKHDLFSWSVTDWATAIAGETGEMCNFAKKLKRLEDNIQPEKDKHLTRTDIIKNIGEELADIVIYADLLATRLGLTLSYEIIEKFNKTSDSINSNIKL